ncbi:MAG: hypothetical protein Q9160_002558 [Pyrenula sp. 1 TL-2023]
MGSEWGDDILSSLNSITGEVPPQLKPQLHDLMTPSSITEAPAIQEDLTPASELEKQILQACSDGDVATLQRSLSHPSANPMNTPSSYQMLLTSVLSNKASTVSYLLNAYKRTPVTSAVLSAALAHKSVPIFALLVKQDSRILEKSVSDQQGSLLTVALKDPDPKFAASLLGQSPDFGATIQSAKDAGREDIVKLLESAAQDQGIVPQSADSAELGDQTSQRRVSIDEEEPLPLYDENSII